MRIVFMGTPEFALPALLAVRERHDIVAVISQPDKPSGRGGTITPPPVARVGRELGFPVFQPTSVRRPEFLDVIRPLEPELAVVVAFGKILPASVLAAFPRGCVNVHGSVLPAYRGAAPVQRAVIDGCTTTGVSIMQLDEGMDTGPVFASREIAIDEWETAGELMARLAEVGAALLVPVLDEIAAGVAQPTAQDGSRATHAAMLEKSDGAVDFSQSMRSVAARICGVDPWPSAFAQLHGQPIRLFRPNAFLPGGTFPQGHVVAIDERGLWVQCSDGALAIAEVQAAGKRRMTARSFAAGRGIAIGDRLERGS